VQITEIRVKLAENHQERLLAFCTLTFDGAFVVRDVKIIEGPRGPFVAMPSRKVTARCPRCRDKNHMRANYCNACGERLEPSKLESETRQRPRLYVDIAHPINQRCRNQIEASCLEAFQDELKRSKQPGYRPQDIDDDLEAHARRDVEPRPAARRARDAEPDGELQAE
jgi:stage V sporulation protein G